MHYLASLAHATTPPYVHLDVTTFHTVYCLFRRAACRSVQFIFNLQNIVQKKKIVLNIKKKKEYKKSREKNITR